MFVPDFPRFLLPSPSQGSALPVVTQLTASPEISSISPQDTGSDVLMSSESASSSGHNTPSIFRNYSYPNGVRTIDYSLPSSKRIKISAPDTRITAVNASEDDATSPLRSTTSSKLSLETILATPPSTPPRTYLRITPIPTFEDQQAELCDEEGREVTAEPDRDDGCLEFQARYAPGTELKKGDAGDLISPLDFDADCHSIKSDFRATVPLPPVDPFYEGDAARSVHSPYPTSAFARGENIYPTLPDDRRHLEVMLDSEDEDDDRNSISSSESSSWSEIVPRDAYHQKVWIEQYWHESQERDLMERETRMRQRRFVVSPRKERVGLGRSSTPTAGGSHRQEKNEVKDWSEVSDPCWLSDLTVGTALGLDLGLEPRDGTTEEDRAVVCLPVQHDTGTRSRTGVSGRTADFA